MSSSINLFIAQLDRRIDDNILRKQFEKFGQLISVSIAKDELGCSKGFGFVQFSFMADGLKAIEEMNGRNWYSRTIKIEVANNQDDGRCNVGPKTLTWASEWNVRPSTLINFDDCDSASQASTDSAVDEQNNSDVKERMRKLVDNQLYTDVEFFPKDSDSDSISAHRAVLAVGSPLFEKMLIGAATKYNTSNKMEVRISNLSFKAFKSIVRYLYTDEVLLDSDSLVQEIMKGAHEFEIQSLVDRCNSFFENQLLTEENVCSKLQMSTDNKMDVLKNRCIQYIQANTFKVIKSDDFQRCSHTTLRTICKLQTLNLRREVQLLEAVIIWLDSQSPMSRKQMTEPLLKSIRFLTFTVNEITNTLRKHPDLIGPEDGLQLVIYLTNPPKQPNPSSLPVWCNKSTSSRCVFSDNPVRFQSRQELFGRSSQRRLLIPLKQSQSVQNVNELTSLLQMKCLEGRHEITAIKLSFQQPVTDESIIRSLTIVVVASPSGFHFREDVEIANSPEVRIELLKKVLARPGDKIDFEVEAKNIELYRFLQFDDSGAMPSNPHFECCVASRPSRGRLFLISEIEYGPQVSGRNRQIRR